LIDRIKHGDFDTSQYFDEAKVELKTYNEIVKKETKRGKLFGLSQQAINDNIFNEGDQYIRRYNRLMKDFQEDETNLINELHFLLCKKFGKKIVDSIYTNWLKKKEQDMSVEQLYYRCLELKQNKK
jgi:hypothetical protein